MEVGVRESRVKVRITKVKIFFTGMKVLSTDEGFTMGVRILSWGEGCGHEDELRTRSELGSHNIVTSQEPCVLWAP